MKQVYAFGSNIGELPAYESLLNAGERAEVKVNLSRPLLRDELLGIQRSLEERGVILTGPIKQTGAELSIGFIKAPVLEGFGAIAEPVLTSIAYVLGGAAAFVVGWWLVKSTAQAVPWWVWALGGAVTGYILLRQKK